MLKSARKHLRSVAMLGVAGALVVGGVAVAQSGSGGGSAEGKGAKNGQSRDGKPQRGGPHGGPPGIGVPMKAVTYAEFHVQTKEGGSKVIRIDQGTVAAVSDSSITVKEKDDSEVTIDVDENTKIRAKGVESVTDLEEGQRVVVKTVDGGAAKSIAVPPKKGERKGEANMESKGDRHGPPSSGRRG